MNDGLYCKEDMAWFREITKGKVLVAAARTYDQVQHLDGMLERRVIRYLRRDGTAASLAEHHCNDDLVIVGGRLAYSHFAHLVDQLYLSRIDYGGPADTYFPIGAFRPDVIKNAVWRS